MKKKLLSITALLVILALLSVAAVFIYLRYSAGHGTFSANNLPKNPPVMGTLAAVTPTSITLTFKDNTSKTFSVSTSTQVVTQVKTGEVGRVLADISVGTQVLVQPTDADASAALRVSVMPIPAITTPDPAGPPFSVSGTVLATTTSSITIAAQMGQTLHIAITKDTVFLTNVFAGQRGKGLKDIQAPGYVVVMGATTPKGLVARSIQVLVPLMQ